MIGAARVTAMISPISSPIIAHTRAESAGFDDSDRVVFPRVSLLRTV